jgi:proteic killer suppression protein
MILSFTHKGLERFYSTGSKAGIQAKHADKLRRILSNLNVASCADDLNLPAYRLHELKGSRKGVWSITVQTNWRITFCFIGEDIELINYEDYH